MDLLVAELEARRPELMALPVGGSLVLASGLARTVQRDRNHVIHLRTRAGPEYFLKIPATLPSPASDRSELGRWMARAALRDEPGALLPAGDRMLPGGGELVARIPGLRLNSYLYGRFLIHHPWHFRRTFHALGRSLARLHRTAPRGEPSGPTDRRVELRVLDGLSGNGAPAFLTPAGAVAATLASELPAHFVHGNLALTNVLCHRGRVGLIDFENAGAGVGGDDLGRVLQHLFCLELATSGWRVLTGPAVRGLLAGYRECGEADAPTIAPWLYLHLVDYYITRFVRRELGARVGGRRIRPAAVERVLVNGLAGCTAWLASRGVPA